MLAAAPAAPTEPPLVDGPGGGAAKKIQNYVKYSLNADKEVSTLCMCTYVYVRDWKQYCFAECTPTTSPFIFSPSVYCD